MLTFIKHTYKLYFNLLIRFIIDLGIRYTLITLLIACVGVSVLFATENVIIAALLNFLLVALVLSSRKDKPFLALQSKYASIIIGIDCILLSTPIIVRLLIEGKLMHLAVYIALLSVLFLTAPHIDKTSVLNFPLKRISQLNLIIKSNIRKNSVVMASLMALLHFSVFFDSEHHIQVYIYQVLLLFVCLLPSEADNSWHIKMFGSPKNILLKRLKDLSITFTIIGIACIVPFILSNTLSFYIIISLSGLLSININSITSTLFASNKLLTIITHLVSVSCIFMSFKLPYTLIFQLIVLTALSFYTYNALKSRYQW
ncbi:hypothetical protein [Saccharicrinis aurantiacus]|uniref:hypothetical protein n=1 Tax=Saccharicrinis aurantiacus TaxID=1849719 RepID=UPI00094F7BD5|nr:hypothetical protein [Saccharicrinis aurantiacus]